jgi:hypothetical protein
MKFESAVLFIGEKLDRIFLFLVKFDGFQETLWSLFFIFGGCVFVITTLCVVRDFMLTAKVQTREQAAREIRRIA